MAMAISVHTFFFDHPFLCLLLLPVFFPLFLFCLPLLLFLLLPTTFFFLLPLFLLFKLASSLRNSNNKISISSGKHFLDRDHSAANLRPILGHDHDHDRDDLDAACEALNPAMAVQPMVKSEPSLLMPLLHGDVEEYKDVPEISSKDEEDEEDEEGYKVICEPSAEGRLETQLEESVDGSNNGLSKNLQENNLQMVPEPTFTMHHQPLTFMEGAYVVSEPSEEKLGTRFDANLYNNGLSNNLLDVDVYNNNGLSKNLLDVDVYNNNGLSKNLQEKPQIVSEPAFMQQPLTTIVGEAYSNDAVHAGQKEDIIDFSDNKVTDELNNACQKHDGDFSEEMKRDDHLDLNKVTDEQNSVHGMKMEEEEEEEEKDGYVPSPPIQGEGFVSVAESSLIDKVKGEEEEEEEEEEEKDFSIPSPPIQGEGFVYAGDQSPHVDNMKKEESMDDDESIKKGTLGEEPSAQDQAAMYNYCGHTTNDHVKGDEHESRPFSAIDSHGEILLANGHGESTPDHEVSSMDGNEKTEIANEHESADVREASITSNGDEINIVGDGSDGDPHHEEAFTSSYVKEPPINIKGPKSEPHEEEESMSEPHKEESTLTEEEKKKPVNAELASCDEEAFMSDDDEVKKHPSHLGNGNFSIPSTTDVQEEVECPVAQDLSSDISGTRQVIIDPKQEPKDTKAVNGGECAEPLIEGLPVLEENNVASMEDLQVSDSNPAQGVVAADNTAEQHHLQEPYNDGNAKLGWKLNLGVPDAEHVEEEPQKALDGKAEGWGFLNLKDLSAKNDPKSNPIPKQGIEEDPHRGEVENSQKCADMESPLKQQGEHIILDDIKAIRKILGCDGNPNANMFDQIRELYTFLGMEPLSWIAEVNDLERARGELDVLKAVVGVK